MKKISVSLALMACLGMILPPTVLAETTAVRQTREALDVSLHEQGLIVGQVVTPQGVAKQNEAVVLLQNGQPIAKTSTDQLGRFAVKGLKSGIYQVATADSQIEVRAWTKEVAPPNSAVGAMLITGDVVNAQCHCHGGGASTHGHGGTYGSGNGAAAFNQGGSGQVVSGGTYDGGVVSSGTLERLMSMAPVDITTDQPEALFTVPLVPQLAMAELVTEQQVLEQATARRVTELAMVEPATLQEPQAPLLQVVACLVADFWGVLVFCLALGSSVLE